MSKVSEVLFKMETKKEIENFLLDVLTIQELEAIETRWKIAQLLHQGELSYLEIASKTGASTTTVTRVNKALNHGNGGYLEALKKSEKK